MSNDCCAPTKIDLSAHIDLPTFRFALREDLKDDVRFLPKQAEPEATGYDCASASRKDIRLRPGQYAKIPLGFRCFCPPGWYYELHPRSSLFVKKQMHTLIGIIDECYPDETVLAIQYLADVNSLGHDVIIKFGDRIAQIVFRKREDATVAVVSNEEINQLFAQRNAVRKGGIGSTG